MDTEKIEAIAEEMAREFSLSLFDLELAREGPRTLLRVYLDRKGGVTLSEIQSFSRRFSAVLDVEDPLRDSYVLEVSSPGVNRRLRLPRHFALSVGQRVKVTLLSPLEGRRNFIGILAGADSDGIDIQEGESRVRIKYESIRKANLDVTQEELFGKGKKNK
ncbi:MAG: ribosome maturation factor RimP [Syntrophorhabdaceae bacterium]|nr:ribosome maturation factor RimP [Syntrophorhabdaceae bacterium]